MFDWSPYMDDSVRPEHVLGDTIKLETKDNRLFFVNGKEVTREQFCLAVKIKASQVAVKMMAETQEEIVGGEVITSFVPIVRYEVELPSQVFDGPVPSEFEEQTAKMTARLLLADGSRQLRRPTLEEWIGLNMLERDDELPRQRKPHSQGETE